MGLKLFFLALSGVMSLLRSSRQEEWWKDAEILMLRHQLAVAMRGRLRAAARLIQFCASLAVVRIRPGDVVNVAGGEWHWHGAAPGHFMTHLSLTEGGTEWGEHVTGVEYGQTPG